MTPFQAAERYIECGLLPIPIPFRKKAPNISDWPSLRLTKADLPKHFNGGPSNLGVILGDDCGAADVDLDCSEAIAAARELLPETGLIFGRQSKPASHYFYRSNPPVPSKRFLDPVTKECLAELRCQKADGTIGLQTVVPPSVHPEGEQIRFETGFDKHPADVDASTLQAAVAEIAAVAVLARHWPSEKAGRNQAFIALAGASARGGWSLDRAIVLARALYRVLWGAQADLESAAAEVRSTYEKHRGGFQTTGARSLADLIDPRALNKAFFWLGIPHNSASAHNAPSSKAQEDWRKLEPIQSELPPVQAFSEDLLPSSFRPLVRDIAERMQVPMDLPASVIVLCLAGAVNRRAVIQPKASDTSWVVVPNLWGGIITPPGFMKSPVIQAVTYPLNQIQTELRQAHEDSLKGYALAKEEFELRRTAWKEQYKATAKNGKAAPNRPEDEPEEPKLPRLIVNDATFEALHQTMSENPAGILVIRDELTGWLSQLDRAGREGERAFSLEAWNGNSSFTIDRIGRGTIHVPHCCMSMLGGIQPGRLRSYLVDALKDGPGNDGLMQRFQVLVWPDPPPDWTYVDRLPDATSKEQAERVLRRLATLDAENPARFCFAPDAQELFIAWLAEHQAKIRGGELHSALISHLSKYRKLMPALALLFELADRAAGSFDGFEGSDPGKIQNFCVSLEHARQAAAFCEYLESHARRVYFCVVTPQLRAARELAEEIKQRKVGGAGFFSCRDVYLKGWSGLDTPEAVKLAAEMLEDAGWVREVSGESGPSGGRPPNRYEVSPEVWR